MHIFKVSRDQNKKKNAKHEWPVKYFEKDIF
jgi:hypothetical protein